MTEVRSPVRSAAPLLVAALLAAPLAACSPDEDAGVVSSEQTAALDPAARDSIVTAARDVLDAINESDPELLREVMTPNALIVSVAPDRDPARSTVDAMAAMLADPPQDLVERMWDPRVESDGTVASVWAPYDFYRDGELSHCGVDAFQLVRTDDEWKVQSVVYSYLQPPACQTHPAGPPPSHSR